MNKELQWLKENYKYLSIPAVEKDLNLARKTIYKYVTAERELPIKYHDQVTAWIKDFKNGTLADRSLIKTDPGNDSKQLYQKALKAYLASCKRKNVPPTLPGETFSEITGDLVNLKNGSSLIATYNYRKERFVSSPTINNN